ncbi:MAG: hypothetical protein ACI9U2_002883 [Bradymonadia bacterium]
MSIIEPGDRARSDLYAKLLGRQASVGGRGTIMPQEDVPDRETIERIGRCIDGLPHGPHRIVIFRW